MNRFKLHIYINHLKGGIYYYLNCHDLINKWTEYGNNFYGIDALFFLKQSVFLAIICQHYETSESEGFWEEPPQPQPEIILKFYIIYGTNPSQPL